MSISEALVQRAGHLERQYERLTAEAVAVRADYHKFRIAEAIMSADLPAGSLVRCLYWDDEPNEDGTYDIGLSEALVWDDGEWEEIDDLSGVTAFPMGWSDGDHTDIDEFLNDDDEPCIEVDKVRAWVDMLMLSA